jgi:hypothetical protein
MKVSSIYITNKSVRLAQAVKRRGGEAILKEEKIDFASLKERKLTSDYLVLCIPRTQVSIKYLTLPATNETEIKNIVEFELNNLFPYKAEELIYDHAVIHKGKDNYSRLILAVAPKEIISKQIFSLKRAGLSPDAVNISTVSLFNQFLSQKRPAANYFLINLEDNFMEVLLVSEGKLEFSRGISIDAKGENKLIEDIATTITILKDKGNLIDKVILSGKGLDLQSFAKSLRDSISYEIEVDDTLDILKSSGLIANGNALKINLLPQDLRAQKEKIKKRRSLFIFAALLLLNLSLIANIAFFGVKARKEYLFLLESEIQKIYPQASILQNRMLNLQIAKEYINSGRLALGLLSELYSVSPEGINLSSLDIQSQRTPRMMVIAGQAKNPEIVYKFADGLRDSALIRKADVSFVSKTNPNAGEQMVNFEIKSVF